jgi:hypothetical protein
MCFICNYEEEVLFDKTESQPQESTSAQNEVNWTRDGFVVPEESGYEESLPEASLHGVESFEGQRNDSTGVPYGEPIQYVDKVGVSKLPLPEQSYAEESKAEHLAVLGMARRLLAAPSIAGAYDSVTPSAGDSGLILAMNDIFELLEIIIAERVVECRSRSIAITKLQEASMWANRAASKGE